MSLYARCILSASLRLLRRLQLLKNPHQMAEGVNHSAQLLRRGCGLRAIHLRCLHEPRDAGCSGAMRTSEAVDEDTVATVQRLLDPAVAAVEVGEHLLVAVQALLKPVGHGEAQVVELRVALRKQRASEWASERASGQASERHAHTS